MSGDFRATTTQLLHRQSSSQQHLRQYTFASTIADRFFSDNSLDRQRRVVECARRRQVRAREKALQQAYRLEQLENELAESERVRALKEEREHSRMQRKLQHVAAAYIQYIWRRYCQLREEEAYRLKRAERLVVDFLSYRTRRRKTARRQASFRIQRRWRCHSASQKTRRGFAVLRPFFLGLIRMRRTRAQVSATRLQRWYRAVRSRKRENAARVLQRAWRLSYSKAKIRYYSRAYRHLTNLRRLEHAACIIQRALGTRAIYRQLVTHGEFEEYPNLAAASWPQLRPVEERSYDYWRHKKRELQDAWRERKRLEKDEISLRDDIEDLNKRLADAQLRRGEEVERLRRHSVLEENRRLKDEEEKQQRLQELEEEMRREIRLELERELETTRRLMLRSKKRSSSNVAISVDERVEV